MAFEIFAFYLKLFEICDYKSNCNKTLTIDIGPFRRWPPKKIFIFFSENDLFSDAIEKIGGCWALHFPKALMKARNGPNANRQKSLIISLIYYTYRIYYSRGVL